MNQLVSVIVPVFNRKKTIKRCLNSILGQSYRNLELIIIDDGSHDGTGNICDFYEKKDLRVKVFHNKNHGVSYSRNYVIRLVVSSLMMRTAGKGERFDMNDYVTDGAIAHDYYTLQKFMGGCGKLYDCQLIKDKHLHFDEDMVYSENRVFNIEYYSHVKYYGIASDSIYTCDYVPEQAVSHLSFTRTEKGFCIRNQKNRKGAGISL